ncbi:MAG: hypothetical protein JSV81_05985 [Anaerolineales bacterium]|nr:MAG: hypothetical protein JSV81_05985 [Anaerolineales bacterium]
MATGTTPGMLDSGRRRKASGISFGLFLIGLGVLLFTGWWWPGIMVVLGLSSGAELIFRGQTARGIGSLAFFWGIALVFILVQEMSVPWNIIGPLILVGVGVIFLVRALYLR